MRMARQHKERKQVTAEKSASATCAWCKKHTATGTLVAKALDDDPVPAQGMVPAKDMARMCFECGWHFHGGHGYSGVYHFLSDREKRRKRKKGKK